jgi:hypothetical protein
MFELSDIQTQIMRKYLNRIDDSNVIRSMMVRVDYFVELFKENDLFPIRGVEVGIDLGEYIYHLLLRIENEIEVFYGVDSYKIFNHYNRKIGIYRHRVYRPKFTQQMWDKLYLKVVERFLPYRNVNIIRCTSEEAVWRIPDDLNYVFIDAAHDYHNVINDIHLWEEKIIDGGIISGHDYNGRKYGEVTEAVNDYARTRGRKVNNPMHLIWWWQVKK